MTIFRRRPFKQTLYWSLTPILMPLWLITALMSILGRIGEAELTRFEMWCFDERAK